MTLKNSLTNKDIDMINFIELQPVRHTRQVVNGMVCLDALLFGADVLSALEGHTVEVVAATTHRNAVALFRNGKHIGNASLLNGEFLDFEWMTAADIWHSDNLNGLSA